MLAGQPMLEVRYVLLTERINEAPYVRRIAVGFAGANVLFEDAPMNRHVPFT